MTKSKSISSRLLLSSFLSRLPQRKNFCTVATLSGHLLVWHHMQSTFTKQCVKCWLYNLLTSEKSQAAILDLSTQGRAVTIPRSVGAQRETGMLELDTIYLPTVLQTEHNSGLRRILTKHFLETS